ncbi:MAG: 50S ribosomal protein L11 methyltransferase [Thermodesulfobacteriota bacterium]
MKSGPYRELHIYEVEGRLEGFPGSWGEEGFLGCWREGGYSFLFFRASKEGLVRDFLEGHPQARMRTAVVLPYEDWEAGGPLRPFRVGRLWIAPPWEAAEPQDGEQLVVVDPGVCFGSGYHPSTRGCLRLLVGLYQRERHRRVLDLGTGTGILALAAGRLGAEHVLAIDLQPLAVETAMANVRRNALEDVVEVRLGDATQSLHEPADLIVANLTYDIICSLLERPWVGPRRWCIFSGVVGGQVKRLKERLGSLGFRVLEVSGENLWFSLLASSPQVCPGGV